MATVGSDFGPYREWLARAGVPIEHVRVIASELTAQAFITTDLDDNQITAFHPGAMQHSHANRVSEARGITLGIVAPDGRQGMIEHAAQFAAAGIPFIFDPGQGLPMFGAEELQRFLSQARWVTVNDYEWQLLQQKSRWGVNEIMQHVEALIVTRGAAGAVIHARGEEIRIPAAPVRAVVDPTGCGDAFRAGLIHGLLHGHDWRRTGHIASLMGAIKVESRGTQNHRFTREEFDERLEAAFG
jgi:adenosine kinase